MNCLLLTLLLLFITLMSQMMSGYSWIFPNRLLVSRIGQGQRQTRLFGSTGPVQRIERILANRGVGTRTEVGNILKQGRVKVKGKVIRSAAERFPTNTEIYLDNKLIEEIPDMVVYHKPVGIQSTYGDPWQRLNLNSLRERFSYFKSLHPIGRLDADSSGLLLFGRDGAITQHLLNPKKKIEREYDVLVLGAVDFQRLKETLSKGINTSEGVFPAALFSSQTFSSVQDLKYFNDLIDTRNTTLAANGGKSADHVDEVELQTIRSAKAVSYLRVAVTEGKYRMVRRILHNSGHSVCFLRRRRYGNILLHPDDVVNPSNASEQRLEDVWPIPSLLAEDEVRKVTEEEWKWIQSLTK